MEAGAELIARARLICGDEHVVTHPAVLSTYRSDGLWRDAPLPPAVVLPGSVSEVVSVVSACAATGMPYTVRGAGTSRSGSALPQAGAVLLVLTRMRRILSADADEITVQAGVPAQGLPHLTGASWFPASAPIGTVGGYVAETAGIANISALELVRSDGSLLRLDGRDPGYDLTGAFPGSRGRAGIAVTVSLRAVRR